MNWLNGQVNFVKTRPSYVCSYIITNVALGAATAGTGDSASFTPVAAELNTVAQQSLAAGKTLTASPAPARSCGSAHRQCGDAGRAAITELAGPRELHENSHGATEDPDQPGQWEPGRKRGAGTVATGVRERPLVGLAALDPPYRFPGSKGTGTVAKNAITQKEA